MPLAMIIIQCCIFTVHRWFIILSMQRYLHFSRIYWFYWTHNGINFGFIISCISMALFRSASPHLIIVSTEDTVVLVNFPNLPKRAPLPPSELTRLVSLHFPPIPSVCPPSCPDHIMGSSSTPSLGHPRNVTPAP